MNSATGVGLSGLQSEPTRWVIFEEALRHHCRKVNVNESSTILKGSWRWRFQFESGTLGGASILVAVVVSRSFRGTSFCID